MEFKKWIVFLNFWFFWKFEFFSSIICMFENSFIFFIFLIFYFWIFLIFDNFVYGFFYRFILLFLLIIFSNFNWSPILFGVRLCWLGLKSTELILKILVYRSGLEWSCTRWSTTDSDQVYWGEMAVSMYSCLCICGAILYFRNSAQKSVFCYMIQNFVNSPFVALGKTVHFAP